MTPKNGTITNVKFGVDSSGFDALVTDKTEYYQRDLKLINMIKDPAALVQIIFDDEQSRKEDQSK